MASANDIEAAQQAKLLRYWEHRAQAKVLATDRTEDAVNRDVLKAYAAATNAVEDELRAFYERFASESGLSVDDARATLSLRERADFRADLARKQEAIRALPGPLSDELQAYLEELGEASKLRKVTRQQRLLLDIEHELTSMSAGVARRLEAGMEVAFSQRFEGNVKDLEKVPAFRAELGAPAPRLLEQATAEKWLGQNFSDRVWDDKEKLVNELRRILSQAAVSHSGIEDLTKKMAKAMGSSLDNARRLVRTELNYVANQASLEGYRKSGVKHYKFLAAIDSRTSEPCRKANGQVFAVEEAEVGVNFPPLHPNCRSTTVAHFTDDDLAQRYDFSHIQLSAEELAELGVSRTEVSQQKTGGEAIELTQREATRAEDAVNKAPLEGESLRVNSRLERLGEDLRFERELEQTLDKGKVPHTKGTLEVRQERLRELRQRVVNEGGRVGELEQRAADALPARKPMRIARLVAKARARMGRWKGYFNDLVERFLELVTEVLGPEPALAGANISLMVGRRGRSILGMLDENERKDLEAATDRLLEAEKKRRERLGLTERDDELFEKLKRSHPKVQREEVIAIDTDAKGGIVYLDRGGLRHLVEKAHDLTSMFGSEAQIIEGLFHALKTGKDRGRQKTKSSRGDTAPRKVFQFIWMGHEERLGINVDPNTRRLFGVNIKP